MIGAKLFLLFATLSLLFALTDQVVLNRDLFPEFHGKAGSLIARNDRVIVLLIDSLGLANRLRSIADWFVLATLSNRKLVVSWRATLDCNASFIDLYEKWPSGLEILHEPLPEGSAAVNWLEAAAIARGNTYFSFIEENEQALFWKINNTMWARQDIIYSSKIDAIFTNYVGLLTFDNMPCSVYKHLRGKFLRSLVPIPQIRKTLDGIYNDIFLNHVVVGVHIRAHNSTYDWAMVPMPGSNVSKNLGEDTPAEHYVSVMQRIYVHFHNRDVQGDEEVGNDYDDSNKSNSKDKKLRSKSRVRFYLISNDPVVKQEVLNYFAGSTVYHTELSDYSRSTTTGIQCALVEFLLLARTQLILQTHGSSFSLEAAAMGELPVASILPMGISYRDSRLHQYCGDSLIAKTHLWNDTSLPQGVTLEGTFDRRIVPVKFTILNMCEDMKNWGLFHEAQQLPVYCYERIRQD